IRILLPVSEVLEASGHAEVKGKPMAVVDFGEEMLAVTAGARKRSALERAGEVLRGGACEDLGRGDADALDLLVQGVSLQVPAVILDVRKLGHVPLLASPTIAESFAGAKRASCLCSMQRARELAARLGGQVACHPRGQSWYLSE